LIEVADGVLLEVADLVVGDVAQLDAVDGDVQLDVVGAPAAGVPTGNLIRLAGCHESVMFVPDD
jgi:hypothetical protein